MNDSTSGSSSSHPKQGGFFVNPPARKRIIAVARPIQKVVQPSSRRSSFKKADVTRAISAAARAGLVATSFEVTAEGTIRVFGAANEDNASLFDQWKDRL